MGLMRWPHSVNGTLTGWGILEGTIMKNVVLIGIDLGKHSFQMSEKIAVALLNSGQWLILE